MPYYPRAKLSSLTLINLFFPFITILKTVVTANDPASFWSSYSSCAVTDCLVPITIGFNCELNDNNCVCTTEPFVQQVASCLGQKCPNDVEGTYNTYSGACTGNGGYTLALGRDQFFDVAGILTTWLESSFWNSYPPCAVDACLAPLTAAAVSPLGCVISNACVCQNETLVRQMATCIGQTCTPADVSNIYSEYSGNCASNGGYIFPLTSSQWQSLAESGNYSQSSVGSQSTSTSPATLIFKASSSTTLLSTTTSAGHIFSSEPSGQSTGSSISASQTSLSEPSSQPTGSSGRRRYTEDQTIALAVGIGVGLPATLASIITLWIVYVRRA